MFFSDAVGDLVSGSGVELGLVRAEGVNMPHNGFLIYHKLGSHPGCTFPGGKQGAHN